MKTSAKTKEMRHEPTQERSAQRVSHILDTASTLISEVGYDNATTNEIAKRAGVPIGSVYQYFPNKEALLHALTKRYLLKLREYFESRSLIDGENLPLMEYLSSIMDTLIEFRKSHKGFKQMLLGVHMNNELSVASLEMNKEFIGLLSKRIDREHPGLSEKRRNLASYILLGMIRSYFMNSTLFEDTMADSLLDETKRSMKVYIDSLK